MALKEFEVFENGSEWVRVDFHLHTKADKEFKYTGAENSFVTNYVEKLKSEGIGLGVVTNHNKFDYEEFKALRKVAKKNGIGLLPGVELSVKDGASGVHCLIVFGDEWIADGNDYVNPFLATAFIGKLSKNFENENGRTDGDIESILETLEKTNRDYFVIFAHVEQANGLWKELKGGRITELSKKPIVQERCLGFQKVRSFQKNGGSRANVQKWWKYRYPAEVEGSDPKAIDQIGKGEKKSFLKLGAISFEAVKFALIDADQRVLFEAPQNKHSWVKSIRFEGGLLNGQKIPFSPNLNCLIGVRGSGKSAILECLRYALKIPRGDKAEDLIYKKELVPYILKSGGTVIVEICDIHGTTYEVSRTVNHQSANVSLNGVPQPGVSINSTLLRNPLYFGQKDLAASGENFGRDLVQKLIGPDLEPSRVTVDRLVDQACEKVQDLDKVYADADKLEELLEEQKDLSFRLKQFKSYGLEKKLAEQKAYNQDDAHVASIVDFSEDLYDRIDVLIAEYEDDEVLEAKYETENQKAIFTRLETQVKALQSHLKALKDLSSKIDNTVNTITKIQSDFDASKTKKEAGFAKAKRELNLKLQEEGLQAINIDEYLGLEEDKLRLKKEIAILEKRTKKQGAKAGELDTILKKLQASWLKEFQFTQKLLGIINDSQEALAVSVDFKGDRGSFVSYAKETFSGSGLTTKHLEELSRNYVDFIDVHFHLEEASKFFGAKAQVFMDQFEANLADLITFQVPNNYSIEYQGKPLGSHSLGQRASAMVLFILAQMDKDVLIVDQPEDDLDNQTVYEDVVKLIQKQKPYKQFLLATHNANFPVLGDAEMIASCEEKEKSINVVCDGIDAKDCQKRIVAIMEGGPEAFQRRREIYQLWRN